MVADTGIPQNGPEYFRDEKLTTFLFCFTIFRYHSITPKFPILPHPVG
jgi:hypothetical protein